MSQLKYLAVQDTIKKILSLSLFVLLAKYLSTEDFGKYHQIILLTSMFILFFSAGTPMAVSYYHGHMNQYRSKILMYKRFFLTQGILAFSGALIFYLSASFFSNLFKNDYIFELAVVMTIIIFFNIHISFFKSLATVTKQLKFFMLATSFLTLFSTIISLSLLIYTKNMTYLIVVLALLAFVTFCILVKKNLKYFRYKAKFQLAKKQEFYYIVMMSSVSLVTVLNTYIDQIMVSIMLPLEAYANLRIGSFQIPFIGIISGSLLTIMVPIISRYYVEGKYINIVHVWRMSIEKATILLIPIIIFCLVFAEEIIVGFFGEKYIGAGIIFQIYMFQWLRAVIILGGVMGAIGLEKELFKNTAYIAVLNIVGNYIMILFFGVVGAAITTTVLNYTALVLLVKKINKRLSINFFEYFPAKVYFISLGISTILALAIKYFLLGNLDSIAYLILLALLFYILTLIIQMKIIYNDVTLKRVKSLL